MITDQTLLEEEFEASYSGTTCCTVFICDRRLIMANLGDSRAILAKRSP